MTITSTCSLQVREDDRSKRQPAGHCGGAHRPNMLGHCGGAQRPNMLGHCGGAQRPNMFLQTSRLLFKKDGDAKFVRMEDWRNTPGDLLSAELALHCTTWDVSTREE